MICLKKINFYIVIEKIPFLLILIIFFFNILNSHDFKYHYFFFSLLFNFYFYISTRVNRSFSDYLLSFFIWAGFWFKFSLILFLSYFEINLINPLIKFNFFDNIEIIKETLLVSSIGVSGLICAFYIKNFFIKKKKINIIKFSKLNKKDNFIIFFLLFFGSIFILISNFYYEINLKGIIPNSKINIFIVNIYKFLIFLFIPSIWCMYLIHFKNKLFFLILIILDFFINLSILSRNMIFSATSYFLFFFKKRFNKKKFNFFFLAASLILLLYFPNIYLVNNLRIEKYQIINDGIIDNNKKFLSRKNFDEIKFLFLNRWVGFDTLFIVVNNKSILKYSFLKNSINERFSITERSFFEKNFLNDNRRSKIEIKQKLNTVHIPGIMAYLFYSGSYFFLFFLIILIYFFINLIEKLAWVVSHNYLFTSFISFVLVNRVINFGYLPVNTLAFMFAILINILAIYVIKKFIRK